MSTTDLSQLSSTELRTLMTQITTVLKSREKEDLNKARAQIHAIADSLGVSINELVGSAKTAKKTVAARYRNPADAAQLWTGRGRQPKWVVAALAAGKTLVSMELPVGESA